MSWEAVDVYISIFCTTKGSSLFQESAAFTILAQLMSLISMLTTSAKQKKMSQNSYILYHMTLPPLGYKYRIISIWSNGSQYIDCQLTYDMHGFARKDDLSQSHSYSYLHELRKERHS